MNRMEFGLYLKKIREEKGLTLEKAAKILDISLAQLANLERGGVKEPKYKTVLKIAKLYTMIVEEIISVFYKSPEEEERGEYLDSILNEIKNNENLKDINISRLHTETLDNGSKEVIIRMYEMIAGKKIL